MIKYIHTVQRQSRYRGTRGRHSPSLPASPPKLPAYPAREIQIDRDSIDIRPSAFPPPLSSCSGGGPILTFQGSSKRKGNATTKCNVSYCSTNSPPIGSTNGGTFRANFRLHCCALRCYGEDGDGDGDRVVAGGGSGSSVRAQLQILQYSRIGGGGAASVVAPRDPAITLWAGSASILPVPCGKSPKKS